MNSARCLARVCGGLALAAAFFAAPQPAHAQTRKSPRPATPEPPPEPAEAVVETSHGRFVIRLFHDEAPNHVRYFVKTAKAGGFDGTTFHRIIPRGIVQGGDPLSKDPKSAARYGQGGLGALKAEFTQRPMARGAVAAVLRPSSPDSAGQQFFVCLFDQPTLTGKFTIFGEVVSGMDVLDAIGATPVDGDRAATRIEMKVAIRTPETPPQP